MPEPSKTFGRWLTEKPDPVIEVAKVNGARRQYCARVLGCHPGSRLAPAVVGVGGGAKHAGTPPGRADELPMKPVPKDVVTKHWVDGAPDFDAPQKRHEPPKQRRSHKRVDTLNADALLSVVELVGDPEVRRQSGRPRAFGDLLVSQAMRWRPILRQGLPQGLRRGGTADRRRRANAGTDCRACDTQFGQNVGERGESAAGDPRPWRETIPPMVFLGSAEGNVARLTSPLPAELERDQPLRPAWQVT